MDDYLLAYRVAEFATLTHDGAPVCWPLLPSISNGRLCFSTGYAYPAKARNAQRNPRVAALFSDSTASGRPGADPHVLVQGLAQVFDQNLQRNTERYVDQILQSGPLHFRLMAATPGIRQLFVGYLTRIWIEVTPQQEFVWAQDSQPPERLRLASRPDSFSPRPAIELSPAVFEWLLRYTRQPVLAYVDADGWPVIRRTQATVTPTAITLPGDLESVDGAPACLTYHRLVGNYWLNDAFAIRGHLDARGRLMPEKVLGFAGSGNDRGAGSAKMTATLLNLRRPLVAKLAKEGRPVPVVRPTPSQQRSAARR